MQSGDLCKNHWLDSPLDCAADWCLTPSCQIAAEVGTRNFFLSPQSQFRNLKEALLQSQFRNFLRNVAPQPQLRNSAIAIFPKSATSSPQLETFTSAIFGIFLAVEWLEIKYFFTTRFFLFIEMILKGQYHKIFSLCFSWINPYEPLSHTLKDFSIRLQIAIAQI
jgi:hypothetical protein